MKLKCLLLDTPMLHSRLIIAMSSLTWAVLLLLPNHVFEQDIYSIMAVIAREEVWGLLFLVHGIAALYSLFNGTRNKVTLLFDGFLGTILWSTSTVACFAVFWSIDSTSVYSYAPPAAMSAELWVALTSWWHLIRHWAEDEREHYARRIFGTKRYP